jgi:Uncharacterised nucleotidyltransferase
VTDSRWLLRASPAFRLMIATSWLAPDSWRARQEEAILRACADGIAWAEYLRLVDRHRTPALSWAALKRVDGLAIPKQIVSQLRKRSDACRMQAIRHLQSLAGVLEALNHAGISVMPLKGPLLSLEMYGDVGLRQSKDLDVLVARDDVVRTQECLEALGWRRTAEYASLTRRQSEFNLRYERHIGYVHRQRGCELELHWRAAGDTSEAVATDLSRGLPSQWQGFHYLGMKPADLALYLCDHGSGHAWARAKWLGDMARIWASQSTDWSAVFDAARITGRERSVLLCLHLLKEAYGLPAEGCGPGRLDVLPSALIAKALRELTAPDEREERAAFARVFEEIRSYRYKRQLWPYKSRWENFAEVTLRRVDFKVLPLPDSLFWLYIPLRPFLWALRHLRDFVRQNDGVHHDNRRLHRRYRNS